MSSILQLASEGRAEDLRSELRRRALASLYYFSKIVCGYDKLSANFHMPLCLDIQNTIADRKRGYLWPRGHFKSTIIAKAYGHWRLCGGGLVGTNPDGSEDRVPEIMALPHDELLRFYKANPDKDPRNLRVAIAGESQDVANKDLKDIKDRTLNGELFRWLFPEMVPEDVNKTKWSESEIVLPRTRSYDESSITCMGVGAKRTGFHYDILIYDDIIGLEASNSEKTMEEALAWFKAAPGLGNDPETVEELIAGTRWKEGTADIYGWAMKYMPYMPANETDPPRGYKFSVKSCYDETGEPAFKERFTKMTLDDIRKRQGDYLFNCNYRNTPTPQGGSKLARYKMYEIINDSEGRPSIAHPLDGTPDVHLNLMGRVSFYDPSAGGKSAACESAIAVVGQAQDGRLFVIDSWGANCGYAAAIEHWHVLNDKYMCWKNGYEQVGHQKEVGEIVTLRNLYSSTCIFCQKQHRRLAPTGVQPIQGHNKKERIELFLEPKIAEGRIYVRKDQGELLRQLDMFPNGDMVDRVDALAYAVHESLPYRGIEDEMDQRDADIIATAARTSYSKTEHNYGGYR